MSRVVKLVIPGELPGLNEIIAASKQHYGTYATMKKDYSWMVKLLARGLPRLEQVEVVCNWYCKNRKRDPDNVAAGVKFILDGIVAAGVLPNDGYAQVTGIIHRFYVDKSNPRVEVELKEVEKE